MRTRNLVDPINAISNPGDRLAADTFGGPIAFKRDRRRELRASANT